MDPARALRGQLAKIAKRFSRRWYWELRARDIEQTFGSDTYDHPLVASVIASTGARTVLDVGCGMGRLFPVYLSSKVERAVGQDLSRVALREARRRFPQPIFQFTTEPIESLAPERPFDLCVSTRALSAVPPDRIAPTLSALARICKHIYLNEFTESDGGEPSDYWFRHDYLGILRANTAFTCIEQGNVRLASYARLGTYYVLRIDRPPAR